MDVDSTNNKTAAGWPMAAGEMAQRVREHDWAATALGPVTQWPVSLRTTVETALAHPLPTIVLWGRELIQIYNDACRDFMGANHPASLGTPVRECCGEACHVDAATCERVWQGESVSLEQTPLPITRAGQRQDAWISRACSPVRDESGRVAGVLLTIIKAAPQQHVDAALRATQARQAFLLRLSDALRPLQDAQAIKRQATRLLGEQLGVNRAFYAEVQGDDWIVVKGYEQGAVALPDGPYSASTFGDWVMATYRAGESLVFHDSRTDTRFSPAQRQAHADVQILAAVGVPLIKEGTLVAILAVHSATPRRWSDDELALLEDAAERTWATVERARAERALAASEAHLRAVLDALPVGVVIADTQGRLLQDNAAHRALWGMQPQATSGLQYGEQTGFWPETGRRIAAHEWAMARALRQGEVVRDELVQCQPFGDGARRFYLNNAAPVHDEAGQIVGGVVVEFDITQRLQAQEQLRLSQELFAAAFANNPAAIVLTRLDDGQVLDVNETWLAMTGERREAVLGQSARYMWPNDQDARRFLATLHATGTVQGWEQAFRRRSGEVFVTQISAQLLTVHGERAILTTLVDITERKRSEGALN